MSDEILVFEPGVYANLTMDQYHGQLTPSPSISSSGLRLLDGKSPAHWWAQSYLNPDRPEKSSPALSFGSAAHALVLGDEVFSARHVVEPWEGTRSKNCPGWKTVEKREWIADQQAAGKVVIRQEELARIEQMAEVMRRYPLVQQGIFSGEVERSMVWQDAETGVWLKARPDVLPASGFVVDYKTAVSAHPVDLQKASADHGYHVQLALVREGMIALGLIKPEDIQHMTFALIAQEKEPPFAVNHIELAALDITDPINRGAQVIRRAVRKFARCVAEDYWPGYEAPSGAVGLPRWMSKRYDDEEKMGLLPELDGPVRAALESA